jgi:IS1 family transposase
MHVELKKDLNLAIIRGPIDKSSYLLNVYPRCASFVIAAMLGKCDKRFSFLAILISSSEILFVF